MHESCAKPKPKYEQ